MIKSKKQSLIVIGAFLLALTLFTTTYAFFNYTKTGVANNIRVGRIYFNSVQGNAINLTNVFPIDKGNINTDTDNVGSVTIHITGDTTYSEGVEYLVSAVDVNNTIGTGNNAKTIPISVDVSCSETENKTIGESDNDYFDNRGGNTSLYKVLAGKQIAEGNKLVVGYIKPDQTGIDGTITIKAFIDKDRIAITDTYPERTYTETIGEDTYEVNPNMSTNELNVCKKYFSLEIGTVTVNPNPTVNEINDCVDYFDNIGLGSALQSGETLSAFCDGSGTISGTTLQQVVDYNYLSSNMIDDLQEMNILVVQADNQVLEDFCNGTGEINGTTFQERLDGNYFNSSVLSYLKENHIINQLTYQTINSWTDETTSEWIDGRTVFSTSEWNSLQGNNALSFKIKVEANEGIWVERQGNGMHTFPRDIFTPSINENIEEIYFDSMSESEMNQRYEAATIKADLTYNGEGSVLAWLEENSADNTKYNMYVASDGETFLNYGQLFYNTPGLNNASKIEFNNVNTSRITDMSNMFYRQMRLKELDVTSFDTSNVTNMYAFVYGNPQIEKVDMSGLDLRKAQNMSSMFYVCSNLEEVDLTGVRTRDVTTMLNMFYQSDKLTNINLEGLGGDNLINIVDIFTHGSDSTVVSVNMKNFNFGQVTNIDGLFQSIKTLETVDLRNANASNVTSAKFLFSGCSNLESIYLDNFDLTSLEKMDEMFRNCTSLLTIDLSGIITSSLSTMTYMFDGCTSLTSAVLDNLNTTSVTDMRYMFSGCTNLENVSLKGANTSNVEYTTYMFNNCSSLVNLDLSQFRMDKVGNSQYMFNGCTNLKTIDLSGVTTTRTAYNMFYNVPALETIYVSNNFDFTNQPANMPIFTDSTSLVGGNGTHYDSSRVDKNMAVIDNNDHEGYLTLKTN